MSEWNPEQHPRDTSGRFARKGSAEAEARRLGYRDTAHYLSAPGRAVATEDGRDEVSARIAADPDKHEFVGYFDTNRGMTLCRICGDNEGANDHLDPADPSHVWMDVEGLTAGQIDTLDAITDALATEFGIPPLMSANLVSDWITGTGDMSPVLADPEAIDGARAFVSDALTDRAENAGHPADCLFCRSGESSIHDYEPPQA